MKRIAFNLVLIAFICFVNVELSAQCKCAPTSTLASNFQRADVIFVGKVIEARKVSRKEKGKHDVFVKFEVTQTWKQDSERFVTAQEPLGSLDGFEPGAEWLLYASIDEKGTLQISRGCCRRTARLATAIKQGDLTTFEEMGEKPKKIIPHSSIRT